ncbi:MAG: hypothetical protein QXX12_02285 [Nanopusillaceae archaeon]
MRNYQDDIISCMRKIVLITAILSGLAFGESRYLMQDTSSERSNIENGRGGSSSPHMLNTNQLQPERTRQSQVNNQSPDKPVKNVVINAVKLPLRNVLDILRREFGVNYIVRDRERFSSEEAVIQRQTQDRNLNEGMRISSVIIQPMIQPQQTQANNQTQQTNQNLVYISDISLTFSRVVSEDNLKEFIEELCFMADISCSYNEQSRLLEIRRYEEYAIERSFFYNFQFSENLASQSSQNSSVFTGQSSPSPGQSAGVSSASRVDYSVEFNNVINAIRSLLSNEGNIITSPSAGFIYVIDRPSYVRRVKNFLEKEKAKQEAIGISVRILRLDYFDNISAGIDWSATLSGFFRNIGINASSVVTGTGLTSIQFQSSRLSGLLNLLQQYGKTDIVHSWNAKVRAGIPIDFRNVETIPYVVPISQTSNAGIVVSYEPRFVDVGIKLNIVPNIVREGERVKIEGNIFLEASTLTALRSFPVDNQGNTTFVPQTKQTKSVIPFSVYLGDAVVITGFRIRENIQQRQGIPILSQIPILGSLFGYQSNGKVNSELIFIIEPFVEER